MRPMAAWILVLCLAGLPTMAGTPGDDSGNKTSAKSANSDGSAPKSKAADGAKTDTAARPEAAALEEELEQLRELLVSQSKQLEATQGQLKEQQQRMEALESELREKSVGPASTNVASAPATSLSASADSPAPAMPAAAPATPQTDTDDNSPAAIRYKGITITPGGFLAAEGVWRQRGLGSDVNTPFNSIPFPGASQSRLSELNFSARQSRISLLAEGKLGGAILRGYYETDWLGAGTTSNNNQSNSYVLRQRQIWGQAAIESGWTFTGGQMWSLVTETKHGVDNRTEAAPLTIDAQYTTGFSWARQFGFRISKDFGDKLWLAVAVENPQTTFGGKVPVADTLIAEPGTLGGLFNNQANYSFNETPDFVLKAAFEPGWGHYELFGVVGTARTRIFPCAEANALVPCSIDGSIKPSALGASNDTTTTGGIGANARVPLLAKRLDAGIHFFGGDGTGRYGTTGLSNVTAHPDGTLVPIRSYQALGSLEWHIGPKLDVYAYVGGEYDGRTSYAATLTTVTGTPPVTKTALTGFGYGSPLVSNTGCFTETPPTNQNTPGAVGTCEGDTRRIIEGTLGFWYRFYKGPKGAIQWGSQYSYIDRIAWSGTGATPGTSLAPHEVENMVFTSFRYYLP